MMRNISIFLAITDGIYTIRLSELAYSINLITEVYFLFSLPHMPLNHCAWLVSIGSVIALDNRCLYEQSQGSEAIQPLSTLVR